MRLKPGQYIIAGGKMIRLPTREEIEILRAKLRPTRKENSNDKN